MANEEHLALLQQDKDRWNLWRKEHPDLRPDLSHARLHAADLGHVDLRHVDLHCADLSSACLFRADLRHADLSQANLRAADLPSVEVYRTNLSHADLSHARLYRTFFNQVDLHRANLDDADLRYARLHTVNLSSACLHKARLQRASIGNSVFNSASLDQADLHEAYLAHNRFQHADLHSANLSRSNLSGADLSFANLEGANLKGAYLANACLFAADLRFAHLLHASLADVESTWADISSADFAGAFIRGMNLEHIRGKDRVADWDLTLTDKHWYHEELRYEYWSYLMAEAKQTTLTEEMPGHLLLEVVCQYPECTALAACVQLIARDAPYPDQQAGGELLIKPVGTRCQLSEPESYQQVEATLHQLDAPALYELDQEYAPFYCPLCQKIYCPLHFRFRPYYENAAVDGWIGICPRGHRKSVTAFYRDGGG